MTRSSNLEFSYFEDLNREVLRIRRESREENSIPSLSNQEPLRGLERSLDSPLVPNLGRGNMGEVREKTLRELVKPDEDQRPLCIIIPPTTQPFELKSGLIHLLPIFKGSSGEDPHKHLKDFHMVCDSMRPHGISKETTKFTSLSFFPYGCRKEMALLLRTRNTVDAAGGGALADKHPTEARELISRMAENSQSFGNRASEPDNSLTKECGVCGLVGHPNDKCPEVIVDVNIVRRYDPHSNTYNSGWRDNPNLRWRNDNQKHTQAPPTSSNQGTNLEDIIKALATNTLSFQQEMKQQMTQLTTTISKMDGKGKLPAQPDHANVSAILLRSVRMSPRKKRLKQTPPPSNSKNDKSPPNDFTPYIPKPPFPSRLAPKKKETPKEEELFEMFRKVQINLPLLDAIQQVPRYAKFLKELCTNKRKTKERAMISQNVSALLKSNIPEKCNDPGRPFLKTAKAIINVDKGSLSVEFDGDIVTFNIFESMRYPDECLSLCSLELHDLVDEFSIHDEFFEQEMVENRKLLELNVDYALEKNNCDNLFFSPQKLGIELKTLPPYLKYIFLGKKNTFPVIISKELNQKQEERLIEVLKKKKQAIGWTLDDIKGISPTFCMHRIILEEGAKEKIQPQRRLNPTLKEAVMKEVLKLKDARIIYLIPNSTWVSPIRVVSKKTGMTVVKNDKGEMVSMRIQNGRRMCIDYRKLNEHVKTKRKQLLLVIMDLMHLGVCHLVFVMHGEHSNVA
ncbi:reverse transcriptase [Cucumis melo var. makuwa]|uniref:Reverse transcriptase n=1 Tax=Cucumis melo var. makuwa TaxID=1194695 RepID=A0A5A7V3J9_CUCMM|nr:reverse transcriptase [Cucumis melo var. makuwa]